MNGLVTLAGLAAGAYLLFKGKDASASSALPSGVDPTTAVPPGTTATVGPDGTNVNIPLPDGGNLGFTVPTGSSSGGGTSVGANPAVQALVDVAKKVGWFDAVKKPGVYGFSVPNLPAPSGVEVTSRLVAPPHVLVPILGEIAGHMMSTPTVVLIVTANNANLIVADEGPGVKATRTQKALVLPNVDLTTTYVVR